MDCSTAQGPHAERSVKAQRYSQDESLPKTKRRSGTSGELGVLYEKNILMLALYQAIKEKYDFTLDTNVDGVGAFDDVVFAYKENNGIEQCIYLQAKHMEDEKKKIYYDDLFHSKKYCLYKYFIDFIKAIKNKKESKYFIIYTNIDFNFSSEVYDKGRRIFEKSKNEPNERLIFKKLELSDGNPLRIFSTTVNSYNKKKNPAFYQFSDINEKDEVEIFDILKSKFENIDSTEKKLGEGEWHSNLKGYIKKLVFAVDQLNEKNLSFQIKEEMKQTPEDSQDQIDFIFEYVLGKIGSWKNRTSAKPLTEKNDYFKEAKEKINRRVLLYPSLVNENELSDSCIRFTKLKYQQVNDFISSGKQLWPISSKASSLNSLVICQALKEEALMDGIQTHFGDVDHHFLLNWHDLVLGYNLLLPAFKAMVSSLMIIACKVEDSISHSQLPVIVDEIVKIICTSDSSDLKKVIVIAPENHELLVRLKEKLDIYDKNEKIVFGDLSEESQENILVGKKIYFQGNNERFSIQELLDQKDGKRAKEVLAELTESELEKLLKSSTIEIGNECPHLSHFESAHIKKNTPIELEQLKLALVKNPGDIFAFVGEENEIKKLLPSTSQDALVQFEGSLPSAKGGYIRLNDGEEVEQFKKLCQITDQALIKSGVNTKEPKPLLHLLQKKKETCVWLRTYSQGFYMNRNFYLIMVDKDEVISHLTTPRNIFLRDFIVFTGMGKNELLNLLTIDTPEKEERFKELASVFLNGSDVEKEFESPTQKRSIHWLKVSKEDSQVQFQWHRSVGEMHLMRHLQQKSQVISEKKMTDSNNQFFVLADEPGMGKSTTLTHISEYMKQDDPLMWVMKFDLNRHQKVIASRGIKTMENFVDLLSDIDIKLKDPLTRLILLYKLTLPRRVALLWDGFDEVDPVRQEAVLALFDFLKKDTASIVWITTRSRHGQRKLEDRLSVLAYPFVPLSKKEQIDFLSRFWTATSKLTGRTPEQFALESYANEVIQRFETSIKGDGFFISIPLRARMLAEVYEKEVERIIERNEPFSEFSKTGEKLWITDLYEQFISRKYEIYLQDKAAIEERLDEESLKYLIRGYTKAYELLAIKALFDEERTKSFLSRKNQFFSLNILSRIGLIQGSEEPVFFIHKTFAEYFAGKWLSEHASLPDVKEFLGTQLFMQDSGVMRNFFDQFFTKDLLLHRAVLKNDISEVQELLMANSDQKDGLDRTALHLAAQEGRLHFIECFWTIDDVKLEGDQFGKTPLHYAACFGHDEAINELLKNYIDIDLYDHILRKPLHFGMKIGNSIFNSIEHKNSKLWEVVNKRDTFGKSPLYIAAENGLWNAACILLLHSADSRVLSEEHKRNLLQFAASQTHGAYGNQEHALRPVVGSLSLEVPVAVKEFSDNYEYPRLLSYFFTNGHTKVIDALLGNIQNARRRKRIVNQEDNFRKPFKRFFEKNAFSSADHLKFIKYLLTRGIKQGIKMDPFERERILHNAAEEGHLDSVKYLVRNKVEVNTIVDNGSLIDNAIIGNNSLAVLKYLWWNYRTSIKNYLNRTPLHAAVFTGNLPACRYLCEQGADVNARNNLGQTPLHLANLDGMLRLVKYLVEKQQARFNIPDNENKTALDRAIEKKQWQIVKYLIGKGAQGWTNSLLSSIKSFFENSSQKNLLYSAIKSRNTDLIQFLLQHQVDVNYRDDKSRTLLHWAAMFANWKDQAKVIKWLLQRGAQYDAVSFEQKTALNLLIGNNSESCKKSVRLLRLIDSLFNSQRLWEDLIEKRLCGDEIENQKLCGVCYFELDASDSNSPMRIILNTQSIRKGNLLHVAANACDIQALTCLLKFFDREYLILKHQNSDHLPDYHDYVNVEDEQGNMPLDIAAQRSHHEMIVLLLKYGAIFKTKAQTAAEYLQSTENLFNKVKSNCELHITINDELQKASLCAKDDEGKTLLHLAIEKGNVDTVRMLLDLGLDVETLDNQRNTPLHEAAKHSQIEIIRLLLQREARFNVKNKDGKTPLNLSSFDSHLFLFRIEELFNCIRSNYYEEVILKKLRRFISTSESDQLTVIQVRDKHSCTLLHWASRENCVAVVKQLLQWGAIYDVPDQTKKIAPNRLSYSFNREIRDLFQFIEEWMDVVKPVTYSIEEIKSDPIKVNILKRARNRLGETPLHVNTDCFRLKFLLDQGADLAAQDLNGNTPLHRAVERGDTAIVKLFLDRNANVNAKNKNNQTSIILSKKEIITLLLQIYESRIQGNEIKQNKTHIDSGRQKELNKMNSLLNKHNEILQIKIDEKPRKNISASAAVCQTLRGTNSVSISESKTKESSQTSKTNTKSKSSCDIIREKEILTNNEWLTDVIMDKYIYFLVNKFGTSNLFLILSATLSQMLKTTDESQFKTFLENISFFDHQYVFIIVNDKSIDDNNSAGSHWSFLLCCINNKIFLYFDSVKEFHKNTVNAILQNFTEFLKIKFDLIPVETPQQKNGYDCGVEVIGNIRQILSKIISNSLNIKNIHLQDNNTESLRDKILEELY